MHHEALTPEGAALFPHLSQFPDYYLAGGTALALHIGHRVSVDFDFFRKDDIPKKLFDDVAGVFAGKEIVAAVNNSEELTVFVGGVKLTFLRYPFPLIADLEELEGVQALGIAELAATKAYTIGRRGTLKDYVDLRFVIAEGHATLAGIIEMAEKKYGAEFSSRMLLEQLVYFDDIEDVAIQFLRNEIGKDGLRDFFLDEVRKFKL